MRNIILMFLAILFLSELPLESRGQLPMYNYDQWLPPGTDVHPIDNNPFDDGWIKVFEENFDVDASFPDFSAYEGVGKKWILKEGRADETEPANQIFLFSKKNVEMKNGKCYMEARKEQISWTDENNVQYTRGYSSGGIRTKNDQPDGETRYEWAEGMFEARIQMSPAKWGHDNMWVTSDGGEIDACEMERDKHKVPHHLHRDGNHCNQNSHVGTMWPWKNVTKDFHIYTVIWDKYFVYIIIDYDVDHKNVFPKLGKNLGFIEVTQNSQLTNGAYCALINCFYSINDAGNLNLDQYIFDREHGHWSHKKYKQTMGMPGTTIVDWVRVYKRNPCNQSHTITAPRLFPYFKLDEKNITLATNALDNNGEAWSVIRPRWGEGHYLGESITIKDNFTFYPTPTPQNTYVPGSTSIENTTFLFEAKDCSKTEGINEYIWDDYYASKGVVEDTTLVEDDTVNCYEDLDYDYIDSLIDSAILTNDTAFLNEIYASLDSINCPYEMPDSNSNFNARMARVEEELGKKDPETLAAISRLRVYPNPNNGSFLVATNGKGKYEIQVVNVLGVVVYNGLLVDEQRKSIQLDDALPPGTYTIHINGPGINHVEKLTIIK